MTDKEKRPEHLTDGRPLWDWPSRYARVAWIWISTELLYLTTALGFGLLTLYQISVASHGRLPAPFWRLLLEGSSHGMLTWGAVAVGGGCGGCAFALKWLYHGVAYGKWHQDRLVWRLIVPLLAGVLALFTALMISAGVIPIFNHTIFSTPKVGAAFGFFVGFFSDNVLAALQRVADQTLGTLGKVEERQKSSSDGE